MVYKHFGYIHELPSLLSYPQAQFNILFIEKKVWIKHCTRPQGHLMQNLVANTEKGPAEGRHGFYLLVLSAVSLALVSIIPTAIAGSEDSGGVQPSGGLPLLHVKTQESSAEGCNLGLLVQKGQGPLQAVGLGKGIGIEEEYIVHILGHSLPGEVVGPTEPDVLLEEDKKSFLALIGLNIPWVC
jgi:hypothetical protein